MDDSDDDVSTLLITGGDSKAKKAKSKKSKVSYRGWGFCLVCVCTHFAFLTFF